MAWPRLKIKIMGIWIIMGLIAVLSVVVQFMLQRRFRKFSKVALGGGLTGADVAKRMLAAHGINNVSVTHIGGSLTDHFDPTTMTVNLSDDVFSSCSVAAAAVAAHECGHAVQHATGYAPLRLRTALVPAVNFASNIVQWVLLAGVILYAAFPMLLWVAIGLFAITTLFSFVTLPVEINASHRALQWLETAGITTYQTKPMARNALKWAAYTYVVAALGSLATLLYYIGIARK